MFLSIAVGVCQVLRLWIFLQFCPGFRTLLVKPIIDVVAIPADKEVQVKPAVSVSTSYASMTGIVVVARIRSTVLTVLHLPYHRSTIC